MPGATSAGLLPPLPVAAPPPVESKAELPGPSAGPSSGSRQLAGAITPAPRVEYLRVLAGFIGLALGDALGVPHEFGKKLPYTGSIQYRYVHKVNAFQPAKTLGLGQVSDDTEMALTLAQTLVAEQCYDPKRVPEAYIRWANSGQIMMGTNTRALLKVNPNTKVDPGGYKHYVKAFTNKFSLYPEEPFKSTSAIGEAAQSNGALMRCFPLACIWDTNAILQDVWLTNPSRVALDAELIQVTCIRMALIGEPAAKIWTQALSMPTTMEVRAVFEDLLANRGRDLGNYTDENGERKKVRGWVCNSFYASMFCLASLAGPTQPTFTQLMQWVIGENPGSDTDTNAAIAGGLVGAILGWDAMIKDPVTYANIPILMAGPGETDVPRPTFYTMGGIEAICQGLTALSGIQPLAPRGADAKLRDPKIKLWGR